jgi:hypothetical protein
MGKSTDRPRSNPKPPQLNQTKEILQKLLDIEIARLDVAVRIERERNIVFPETTIIIRDIQKLTDEISKGGIKKESDYLTAEDIINHE